jgi:hypothetical protein
VRSELNHSASFEIAFPPAQPVPADGTPARHEADGNRGGAVLLIDDDDGVRKVVGLLLAHRGFEVTAWLAQRTNVSYRAQTAPNWGIVRSEPA